MIKIRNRFQGHNTTEQETDYVNAAEALGMCWVTDLVERLDEELAKANFEIFELEAKLEAKIEDLKKGDRVKCMLYESQQDLKNQRQAQQVVEEMFGWDIEELNIRYHADWIAFVNKKPHALIEYKRRHCEHDRYDTVFLDVQKYVECKKYADALDIPFYYLQEWNDKYGITQPKMTDAIRSKISIAGSSKRDDVNDYYLMMHLPLKRFTLKSK